METKTKTCEFPGCTNHWAVTPQNGHQRYCSRSHQRKAKKMGLGGAEEQAAPPAPMAEHPATPKPEKEKSFMPPVQLGIAEKWVIENQKTMIEDLKAEKNKLADKLEVAIKERNEFEKQLERTQLESANKPGALSGFLENVVSNPESLSTAVNAIPAILNGLKELIRPTTAIGAAPGADAPQAHALDQWLQQQPEDVRQLFVTIINQLTAYTTPEQVRYALQSMSTAMMRAA